MSGKRKINSSHISFIVCVSFIFCLGLFYYAANYFGDQPGPGKLCLVFLPIFMLTLFMIAFAAIKYIGSELENEIRYAESLEKTNLETMVRHNWEVTRKEGFRGALYVLSKEYDSVMGTYWIYFGGDNKFQISRNYFDTLNEGDFLKKWDRIALNVQDVSFPEKYVPPGQVKTLL